MPSAFLHRHARCYIEVRFKERPAQTGEGPAGEGLDCGAADLTISRQKRNSNSRLSKPKNDGEEQKRSSCVKTDVKEEAAVKEGEEEVGHHGRLLR